MSAIQKTMDSKIKILAIFYTAFFFAKNAGRQPENRAELIEYIRQVSSRNKKQSGDNSLAFNATNININDLECEVFNLCVNLAEKHKASASVVAELLGIASGKASIGMNQAKALSILDNYLESPSGRIVSLSEEAIGFVGI